MGIDLLILLSLLGAWLGSLIDSKYIGLLGFFPIYLGIRGIVDLFGKENEEQNTEIKAKSTGFWAVSVVTFANGGDNIGVYIPLFASLDKFGMIIMISVFFAMVFVWLLLAKYLTKHPLLERKIEEYGHVVTPIVLCFLGIFILVENDSLELVR